MSSINAADSSSRHSAHFNNNASLKSVRTLFAVIYMTRVGSVWGFEGEAHESDQIKACQRLGLNDSDGGLF